MAHRNLTDVAVVCIRVELSMPDSEAWEGETEQRVRLVARSLAAAIRMEDLATRSDRYEFCVATQSDGVASVLRFAARLRKILENVDAAGGGVEVWTCIGVASLSEDMRLNAEQLRQISRNAPSRRRPAGRGVSYWARQTPAGRQATASRAPTKARWTSTWR